VIYHGKVVKNSTERFGTIRHVYCLETEASNSKFHNLYSHLTWYVVSVNFELGF
jgi:hypothetical protein